MIRAFCALDTSVSSSSPSKSQSQKTGSSLSPLKRSSSGSPSKSKPFKQKIYVIIQCVPRKDSINLIAGIIRLDDQKMLYGLNIIIT